MRGRIFCRGVGCADVVGYMESGGLLKGLSYYLSAWVLGCFERHLRCSPAFYIYPIRDAYFPFSHPPLRAARERPLSHRGS